MNEVQLNGNKAKNKAVLLRAIKNPRGAFKVTQSLRLHSSSVLLILIIIVN